MPETATPPAVQTPPASTGAAPPPTDWDASLAHLDAVMQEAAAAANAQRDLETTDELPTAPAAPAPPTDDEAELLEDTVPAPEPSPRPERQEEPGERAPAAEQPKRYSRKDAARLDSELQETTRRLNEASSRASQYEQTDRAIIGRLADLTGSDGTYDRLSTRVLDGSATQQEREQVQQMTEWRKVAGPVYRVAAREVWDAFSKDFSMLRELEGVTDEVYADLLKSSNPAQLVRQVYDLGVKSGQRKGAGEQTRLEAANSALRTRTAAERPQPLPAAGSPPKSGRLVDQMFRTVDGRMELDPDFEKKAERNEFLGVDLTR